MKKLNRMKIIGIKGRKFSGKSTTAKYLISKYGYQEYAFGDPMKEAMVHIFDFSREQLWGTQEQKETVDPRWGLSPRRAMEIVGTDLFQFDIQNHLKEGEFPFGRKIWVQRFKLWYEKQIKLTPDMKLLLSDIRFRHESDAVKELGGEIWEIRRPDNPYQGNHLSETEQDSIVADSVILNSSNLINLETMVDIELSRRHRDLSSPIFITKITDWVDKASNMFSSFFGEDLCPNKSEPLKEGDIKSNVKTSIQGTQAPAPPIPPAIRYLNLNDKTSK
jgi:hypothetical protein